MAGTFNFLDFHKLWNLIPVVSRSSFERYSTPGCELAIIILAAFGLYDFTQSVRAKRLLTTTTAFMVLVIAWCAYEARSYQSTVAFSSRDIHIVFLGLQALPFIALFFLLVFGRLHRFSYTPFLLALVVVVEAVLLFFVPRPKRPSRSPWTTPPLPSFRRISAKTASWTSRSSTPTGARTSISTSSAISTCPSQSV